MKTKRSVFTTITCQIANKVDVAKKLLLISILMIMNFSYANITMPYGCTDNVKDPGLSVGLKWYRNSAEKNALYHQAYNYGARYVKDWVSDNKPQPKTWGVILDIDETTLDNSWYFAKCQETLNGNENKFEHYISNANKSVALPGVVDFTKLVHSLGGYVTMLSNRDGSFNDSSGSTLDRTIANLKDQNVYFDNVVLANGKQSKNPSDKNPRFNAVITGKYNLKEMVMSNELPAHAIIAYFGDNIQDFPKFKQKDLDKLDKNDSVYNKFGNGYFILPNPIYGSWDKYH